MFLLHSPLYLAVAGVVAASACSIEIDYAGRSFSCAEEPACPEGYECVGGQCVGQWDAGSEDAAPALLLEVRVASSADDAEEAVANGAMDLGSTDLELVTDAPDQQFVGMRFLLDVEPGAKVRSAEIQFQVDEVSEGDTELEILVEENANPGAFRAEAGDISARAISEASVPWQVEPWPTLDEAQEAQVTPDIVGLIQPLLDRDDWQAGNALVVIIRGSGARIAESFDGDPMAAPLLRLAIE